MTQPDREELAGRLEELAALEPGWYANVGKRTGERCCQAMREAAAALRQSPSVEEVARVAYQILRHADYRPGTDNGLIPPEDTAVPLAIAQAIDRLYRGSKE